MALFSRFESLTSYWQNKRNYCYMEKEKQHQVYCCTSNIVFFLRTTVENVRLAVYAYTYLVCLLRLKAGTTKKHNILIHVLQTIYSSKSHDLIASCFYKLFKPWFKRMYIWWMLCVQKSVSLAYVCLVLKDSFKNDANKMKDFFSTQVVDHVVSFFNETHRV